MPCSPGRGYSWTDTTSFAEHLNFSVTSRMAEVSVRCNGVLPNAADMTRLTLAVFCVWIRSLCQTIHSTLPSFTNAIALLSGFFMRAEHKRPHLIRL